MTLLYAWIGYFALWAIAIWRGPRVSKAFIALMSVLSMVDLVYLATHDGKGLAIALVATFMAVLGTSTQLRRMMSNL